MSCILLKRCHISCQIPSVSDFDAIIDSNQITSADEEVFTFDCVIAAYSVQSMRAYFFMGVERVEKQIVEDHMIRMRATSVVVKTFSDGIAVKEMYEARQLLFSFRTEEKCVIMKSAKVLVTGDPLIIPTNQQLKAQKVVAVEEVERQKAEAKQQLEAQQVADKVCSWCSRMADDLRKCPCKAVRYCDGNCQRLDWRMHRLKCTGK
jgi:hypothetical protein